MYNSDTDIVRLIWLERQNNKSYSVDVQGSPTNQKCSRLRWMKGIDIDSRAGLIIKNTRTFEKEETNGQN